MGECIWQTDLSECQDQQEGDVVELQNVSGEGHDAANDAEMKQHWIFRSRTAKDISMLKDPESFKSTRVLQY